MIDQDLFLGFFLKDQEDFSTGIPNKYLQIDNEVVKELDDLVFSYCQTNYTMGRGNLICASVPNESKWLLEKRGIADGLFDEVAELCIVKLYDDIIDQFRINKSYEFVGTLEYKPLSKEQRAERAEILKQNGDLPPNMIPDMDKYPIIHTMAYMEHPHKNATRFHIDSPELDNETIAETRAKIFELLTDIYGGDELAAEYVLLTLLSRIQKREDGVPIGVLCINLYTKDDSTSIEILKGTERFIKHIMSFATEIQVDLESLSSQDLIPKKSNETNRLSRGALQLLNSTVVLLDETNMKEGKSEGERLISNMQGIQSLITQQTIPYIFPYHTQNFDCSCPVIIVSTGRSIFKSATPVPVCPTRDPNPDVLNDVDPALIDTIRLYFNQVSRRSQVDIPEEVSKHIQDQFVIMRQKQDPNDQTEIAGETLTSKFIDFIDFNSLPKVDKKYSYSFT